MQTVLDVGSGSLQIPLPPHYAGWKRVRLDIDPATGAEIIMDARDLTKLETATFDAVLCSHNLEHYFRHDGRRVLAGFLHVLKPDGFVEIRVPDFNQIASAIHQRKLDVDDVIHDSPAGPIMVQDILYGLQREIERSGNDFFAHKTAFTSKSLTRFLVECGFAVVATGVQNAFELLAFGFRAQPTSQQMAMLGITPPPATEPPAQSPR